MLVKLQPKAEMLCRKSVVYVILPVFELALIVESAYVLC